MGFYITLFHFFYLINLKKPLVSEQLLKEESNQKPKAYHILHEIALAYQLPHNPLNVVLLVALEQTMHGQLVVAVLDHLLVHRAFEHLDKVHERRVSASHLLNPLANGERLRVNVADVEALLAEQAHN